MRESDESGCGDLPDPSKARILTSVAACSQGRECWLLGACGNCRLHTLRVGLAEV